MDIERKMKLAYTDDMGLEACAVRLRAAIKVSAAGNHREFARAAGVGHTALSNAINSNNFPGREVLTYLYRAHRIDFNFMMLGLFAQLPGDVQQALFPALEAAKHEWDQKQSSNRSAAKPPSAQAQT